MRDRAYRRWRRKIAINHAFNVKFRIYGEQDQWQEHRYVNYEKVIGVDKWKYQDENRAHWLKISIKVADYLKKCSCSMCQYGAETEILRRKKIESRMNDEFLDYFQGNDLDDL